MTTPKWEAGKLYLKGDLVQPLSVPAPVGAALTNADFESGATGWTLGTGFAIATDKKFTGTQSAKHTGTGTSRVLQATGISVAPGTRITARGYFAQGSGSSGANTGRVVLAWFDAAGIEIPGSESLGTNITSSDGTTFKQSAVTGTAPALAATVKLGGKTVKTQTNAVWFDSFSWDYLQVTVPAGLIYKAVQTNPGYSGSVEPAWPATLGLTVVDNQVTWEAVSTSRVVWRADPLLKSGATEPVWPTEVGASVSDGTISWECVSRRVEDTNCPNSKVVVIVAGKVFAADKDIVRYSATANPLDWTTADDAGFLPTGLQQANANDMAVLNQYRGNLVALNANCFQNWQADADPAAMAILDQMDGIGSTWQQAAQPVANDLLFLSQLGVRSVGIAAGAENMAAGDVGMPIDVLVQDAIAVANANGTRAHSTYYPGAGQYWLAFAEYPPAALSISGDLPNGYVGDVVSYQYASAGGVKPHTFSLLSGSLPAGLTMNSAGLVTGTRTTATPTGTPDAWTVRVTDARSQTADVADSSITSDVTFYAVTVSLNNATYGRSVGGTDWSAALQEAAPATVFGATDVVTNGSGTVIVLTTNTGRTSSNAGQTWADTTGGGAQTNTSAIYSSGAYLVTAGSSRIKRSTDAVVFTEIIAPDVSGYGGDNLLAISATSSLVVACGYWPHTSTDNGATWLSPTATFVFTGSDPVQALANDGTKFIAVGTNNLMASSTDGVTWTAITSPFAGTGTITAIAWHAGVWVIGNAAGQFAYSATGATGSWTVSGSTLGAQVNKIVGRAGLFVAVGQSGKIASSPTGATWTDRANNFGTNHVSDIAV